MPLRVCWLVGTCCMRHIYNGIVFVYLFVVVGTHHRYFYIVYIVIFGAHLRHLG